MTTSVGNGTLLHSNSIVALVPTVEIDEQICLSIQDPKAHCNI